MTLTQTTPLRLRSHRRTLASALLLTGLLALGGAAEAATLQVCPSCAYTTIQSAVDAAASGDAINIAPGTYSESVSIAGPRSLTLYSAAGRATIDASGFDRALEILDSSAYVTLADLDLENADGWAGLVNHGQAVLVTVYVQLNRGTFGGIFNTGTLSAEQHSVIASNEATSYGAAGGLNNFGEAHFWNTTFIGNQGHEGGAFKTSGSGEVYVNTSSISGNTASSMGGGYYNSSPQAWVYIAPSTSFSSNAAPYCDTYYDVNQSPNCVD